MSDQAVIARPRRIPARAGAPAAPGALSALGVAALCAAGLAIVWVLAELVPALRLKDAVALYDFTTLNGPHVHGALNFLLHLLDPALFVLWGIALVAVALAGDRPRSALAIVAVLGLAPLTAEQLKPLVAHQHDSFGYVSINAASWPSGHATAATALALCAVLAAPPKLRRYVAVVGALFVAGVAVALLVLAWHMPSDVIGGILLASLWMALAVAALRFSERVMPPRDTGPARS
ncbi:MAG TPA: phosphatase PAP2 family protein [Solirubrobacteraceae bacterium]|jgi:membrane-associated phospholipid phosphatase|nr:phosphatase PAP2 family protein [Solirubrobacteraceae bacterium]